MTAVPVPITFVSEAKSHFFPGVKAIGSGIRAALPNKYSETSSPSRIAKLTPGKTSRSR